MSRGFPSSRAAWWVYRLGAGSEKRLPAESGSEKNDKGELDVAKAKRETRKRPALASPVVRNSDGSGFCYLCGKYSQELRPDGFCSASCSGRAGVLLRKGLYSERIFSKCNGQF